MKQARVNTITPGRDALTRALHELLGERCRAGEPLSKRTSLRIGGEASWWVEPHSQDELEQILELCCIHEIPHHVVGLGSNTLFPDEGIDGVVIRLQGAFSSWRVVEECEKGDVLVEIGAGCVNAHLVRGLLSEGFVGAEFLMLIPGTFGGAVAMNAGTREADLGGILEEVSYVVLPKAARDRGDCQRVRAASQELGISYRHVDLPAGAIVTSATIRVSRGDVELARKAAQDDKDRRNATQPYRLASVGSTFANPPGDYAGRLIEAVGLKGERIGGAQISTLHANFFINESKQATAADFLRLMARARVMVRQRFGVELRPEVKWVGFDGWSALLAFEVEEAEQASSSREVCDE